MKFNIVGKDASILPHLNICRCEICRAPWPEGAPIRWKEEWAAHVENVRSSGAALDEAISSALGGAPCAVTSWIDDPDLPAIDITEYPVGFAALPSGVQRKWSYLSNVPTGWRVVAGKEPNLTIEKE